MLEESSPIEPGDTRGASEIAIDMTEARLFDVFQDFGLIEVGEDHKFSKGEMLAIARTAYWQGISDANSHLEEVKKIIQEHDKSKHNGQVGEDSR